MALPWAHASSEQKDHAGAQQAPAKAFEGVELGTSIEVLWKVEADAEDNIPAESSVWWPAEVVKVTPHASGDPLKTKYSLRYVPKPEFGFEEDDVEATLVSGEQLLGEGEDEPQPWRLRGASHPQGDAETDGAATVTLSQLCAGQTDLERDLGTSLETATLSSLSKLDPATQGRVAAGYRGFADHIRAGIKARLQGAGDSYVLTSDDVQDILRSFRD